MKRNISVVILCFLTVLTFFAGCNDPHKGRHKVTGTITINGEPVANGYITFAAETPKEGTSVVNTMADIKNGRYTLEGGNGLYAGAYTVRIESERLLDKNTGKYISVADRDEGGNYEFERLIPEEFNINSEIKFTVEDKRGTKTFDYDVVTKK